MGTNIRTSPGGPLLRSRTRPLNVTTRDMYRVLTRNLNPGPMHGQWHAISTSGFVVCCPGKKEAKELVWLVGGRTYPRPASLIHDDDADDFRYLGWLLRHHFRIDPLASTDVGPFDEQGVCRKRAQVMLHAFLRGWYPGAQDLLVSATMAADVIAPALRHRWSGR